MEEVFKADVQDIDMEGSVVASTPETSFHAKEWLKKRGHRLGENEFLVGISIFSGENNNGFHEDPIIVEFVIVDSDQYGDIMDKQSPDKKIPARKITEEIDLTDIVGMFKRFEVTLSERGCLEGKRLIFNRK